MTKEEFESRTTRKCTIEQYKIIETVYMFYPWIDENNVKDQIANLFEMHGMRIILDMLPTAQYAEKLEKDINKKNREIQKLQQEWNALKNGTVINNEI